jgi:hypothetical protein
MVEAKTLVVMVKGNIGQILFTLVTIYLLLFGFNSSIESMVSFAEIFVVKKA